MKKLETKTDAEGRTLFRLCLRLRSRSNPTIRPIKRSAWFLTEAEAWRQERKLTALIDGLMRSKERDGISWGFLVDKWELALRDGRGSTRPIAATTIQNYIGVLRGHTTAWWRAPAAHINRGDIRALYAKLDGDGHSRSMQQTMRSALNGIFAWAIDYRLVSGLLQSPANGVGLLGQKIETMPEILTSNEVRNLLKSARDLNHPWYPIWVAAVLTGMRQGELHAWEWMQVDFENKMIYVTQNYDTKTRSVKPTTKGKCWRHIDMNPELEILLKQIKLGCGDRRWVLPRFREWDKGSQARILRTFCVGIGLPSVKFHTLRACWATILMQHGVAPAQVMAMGGWKDEKTMAIYIRRAGIEVRGATACLKLMPPAEVGKVLEFFRAT